MLLVKRRYQGPIIAAVFMIVMIGGLVPDPLVLYRPKTDQGLLDRIRDYWNLQARYPALAPLAKAAIGYNLNSSLSNRVYIGRNHHLYYSLENAALQSAGEIYRPDNIKHFAEVAAALGSELKKSGIEFIVGIAPNAQTIAIEDLPYSASARGPLEYDLAADELTARHVNFIDLKQLLLAYGAGNSVYRKTDTHWTFLGALIAYNGVVSLAGHADWVQDPKSTITMADTPKGGGLAVFLGMQRFVRDIAPVFYGKSNVTWRKADILKSAPFSGVFDPISFESDKANGSRVLIIGDSFTSTFWPPMFKMNKDIQRIGWLHHSVCGFDFDDVKSFDPTLVILVPTERYLVCPLENWPKGLPKPQATSSSP